MIDKVLSCLKFGINDLSFFKGYFSSLLDNIQKIKIHKEVLVSLYIYTHIYICNYIYSSTYSWYKNFFYKITEKETRTTTIKTN